MTRVRISIEDPLLGDVSVEQDDGVFSYKADAQRAAINKLLERANQQVARAYQLTDEAAQ